MSLTSKIRKQGGAAVMTIPPTLLKQLDLQIGAQVALSVEEGRLVAQPAQQRGRRYTLAELLKGSTEMKRLNADVAWALDGKPVGGEVA